MASSVFLVIALLLGVANAANVPSTWTVCKRSLPPTEYETCIRSAIQSAALELLTTGTPSLGVPPLEPLRIPALDIGKGNGPVAVEIKLRDVKFRNLNTVVLDKIRHQDIANYSVGADLHLKKPLVMDAQYELSGKVLVLPITGKGDVHLELDNYRAAYDVIGVPFRKGNHEYLKVDKFNIDFETDKLHMKFENLFDGNKQLGDNMNVFLNENWDGILKELKPAILEAISAAFKSISNQVFSKVPYKELFPK